MAKKAPNFETNVRVFVRDENDHLLLAKRDHGDKRGGELEPPGGGLNPGETIWDAASREVREETGYDLKPDAFTYLFTQGLRLSAKGNHRVTSYLEASVSRQEIDFAGREPIAGVWIPRPNVPFGWHLPTSTNELWTPNTVALHNEGALRLQFFAVDHEPHVQGLYHYLRHYWIPPIVTVEPVVQPAYQLQAVE